MNGLLSEASHLPIGSLCGLHLQVLRDASAFPVVRRVDGNHWEARTSGFAYGIAERGLGFTPRTAENQLTQTDHTHLGQLLTYCAGTQAQIVI